MMTQSYIKSQKKSHWSFRLNHICRKWNMTRCKWHGKDAAETTLRTPYFSLFPTSPSGWSPTRFAKLMSHRASCLGPGACFLNEDAELQFKPLNSIAQDLFSEALECSSNTPAGVSCRILRDTKGQLAKEITEWETAGWIPALPFTSYVTLASYLNISASVSSSMKRGF